MTDLISVVIPTRDRLPLLAQTLHTVLAQKVNLEVIVVDEASTDGTAAWLTRHHDPRVRAIRHEEPLGPAGARNAGAAVAAGGWLAFVDDDDLWLPDKLELQVAAAEDASAAWVYSGALDVTSEPRLLRVTEPTATEVARLPWRNVVPGGGSNVVVDREAFQAVGGFDPGLPPVEDWDLWIRLSRIASPAVIHEPLMAYRIHPGNASKRIEAVIASMEELDRRHRDLRAGSPIDWADAYRWLGAAALRSRDPAAARGLALAGIRARHAGAVKRYLRAVVAVPPREPVDQRADRTTILDRVRPAPVVPWPPGVRTWLEDVFAVVLR